MTAQPSGYGHKLWQKFSSLLVLGVLAAVGYVGHVTHWKLSFLDHGVSAQEKGPRDSSPDFLTPPVTRPKRTTAEILTIKFKSPEAVRKAGIEIVPVKQSPIEKYIETNGIVNYDQTRLAQLSTKVGGSVWRVDKNVGQQVKKGEVLAIIESVEVGKAKAELLTAMSNVEIKEKLLEILKPLTSVVAVRQVKEAEAAVREANVRLYNAHQAMVNLGLPINIAELRKLDENSMAKAIQFAGLPEAIRKELDPEITTANLIPLLAPFDGIIVTRDVVLGEVVTPQQVQFAIADIRKMWLILHVRMENAGKVALGQQLEFKPDGLSHAIVSTVSWISTAADEKTRTIEVRAEVDNPMMRPMAGERAEAQRLLRAHSFGVGRIRIAKKDKALVVPDQAIQYDDGQPIVFVRRAEDTFEARPVQLGIDGEEVTEVLEGVGPSDSVVTHGSHLLKSEVLKKRLLGPSA